MSDLNRSDWQFIILLAVVVSLSASIFLTQKDWYTDNLEVRADWPFRLDQDVESQPPLTVHHPFGMAIEGAAVELGYIRRPARPDWHALGVGPFHPFEPADAPEERVAAFALSDDGYEVLSEGETDEDGSVSLVIPPAKTFHTGRGSPTLMVKVRDGFDWWVGYVSIPVAPTSEERVRLNKRYQNTNRIRLKNLNPQFERHTKQLWRPILVFAMSLVVLVLLAFETRRAWKRLDSRGLSLTLAATFVGTSLIVVAGVVFLDTFSFVKHYDYKFSVTVMSGALILLVLAGIGDALLHAKDLQIWKWFLALGSCVGIGVVMDLLTRPQSPMLPDIVIYVGVLLAVGMLIVQVGMWVVTLWTHSHRVAAIALMALFGLGLGTFTVKTFSTEQERMRRSEIQSQSTIGPEDLVGSSGPIYSTCPRKLRHYFELGSGVRRR